MADFTSRTPVEQKKLGEYLHERGNRPESPRGSPLKLAGTYWGLVLGVILAIGAAALVVQTRVAWDSHRDWVPPATIVAGVLAGLSLGHLLGRGRLNDATPGMGLVFVAAVFTLMNIWRGYIVEGSDTGRDALTILTTVCIAAGFTWLILAAIVLEVRNPTRPPEPAG
jgi:hypothetical protein